LDTHTFYWAVGRKEELGDAVRIALEDCDNEIFVSAASLWEISTKYHIGKFPEASMLLSNLEHSLNRLRAHTLPMMPQHAVLAGMLEWKHRDPFDRMLAAQCILEKLTLASRDRVFQTLEGVETIWFWSAKTKGQ
jgi:PIN domain nuclease of toxin-antitoxin system